jgi:alcohol dehydrogenase (NADP+)
MPLQYPVVRGAEVTVFDITDKNRPDALDRGAVKYVNVNNPEELKDLEKQLPSDSQHHPRVYDNHSDSEPARSLRQCFGGEISLGVRLI